MTGYGAQFPPTRHRSRYARRSRGLIAKIAVAGVIVAAGIAILISQAAGQQPGKPAAQALPGASAGARSGPASPGSSATAAGGWRGGSGSRDPASSPRPGASAPGSPGAPGAGPGASQPPQQPKVQPPPGAAVLAGSGVLLGAYAQPSEDGSTGAEQAVTALNSKLGRKLAIDQHYVSWTQQLPIPVLQWDQRQGMLPMVSWSGIWADKVVFGDYDSRFRSAASALKMLGKPVLLRWFAGMDSGSGQGLAKSPARFTQAWRHAYQIFKRAGATNVSWVWCPVASDFGSGQAQRYYPGNGYVDWVCADGYNYAPKRSGVAWQSFSGIFGPFYRWGLTTGKPLMVGEFGVLERHPGEKAAWLRQAGTLLSTTFPAIRAIVYTNSNTNGYNWRITSSASALAAFRSFGAARYFAATPKL